jgi:hypothetical protein
VTFFHLERNWFCQEFSILHASTHVFSLISWYSRIYSVISQLPSSSGAFQNKVIESSVISTGSGDPGLDGCSEIESKAHEI